MNIFEGIFNFEASLGIIIMGVFIMLTIYSFFNAKTIQKREHYMIALGIEILILYFIIYTMRNFSPKTKKILGALDAVKMVT